MFRILVALCAIVLPYPRAAGGQIDSIPRVPTQGLRIPLPGFAVIRDSANWVTLWHRFGEVYWREGVLGIASPPPVDFNEQMLIAVSMGTGSGCSNQAKYIHSVDQYTDSLVLAVGPERRGPYLTCMMLIEPVDVVRLAPTDLPVVLRPYWKDIPVPDTAEWWATPSLDELARMPMGAVFRRALAGDPATPREMITAMARGVARGAGPTASLLLERPEVQEDPITLLAFINAGVGERKARSILIERHARAVSRNPDTPRELLDIQIRALMTREYADSSVARLLLENPTVRGDRDLLLGLIYGGQHFLELRREACRTYLAQWPEGMVMKRDRSGRPISFGVDTLCRDVATRP